MKGKETFRVYPGTPFCDIGECPYREAIARCYSRGWFLGMAATRFGPDRPMERAMLAAVLHRVAGCPQPPRRGLFFDVSPRSYCAQAADWCACQGILPGPGPGLRLARGLVPAPVPGGGSPGGGQLFPAPVTAVPPAA